MPLFAIAVITLAVIAMLRGHDVRLVLILAALAIAGAAGDVTPVVRTFLDTFSDEKFVLPICSAMGFSYVIRHCGCDVHLVRLLLAPVRRMRGLIVPGVVLAAFTVNIPVISQASTVMCVGPVAIPLLKAAGYSPAAIAATLCLGASIGGELLNPGAPELQTVFRATGLDPAAQARGTIPPLLALHLAVALVIHWWRTRRTVEPEAAVTPEAAKALRINYLKAVIPLVPLALLFLTGPPWNAIHITDRWLTALPEKYHARLIAVAMLVGVAAAAIATPHRARDAMKQFFEGAGHGFGTIVSLIVTANCLGQALKQAGLAQHLGEFIQANPHLLTPLAAVVPWVFAMLCGSGMATTQSLFEFFHAPALALGADANALGAMVSVASAAGRTMSPVAAVVLLCATLNGTTPISVVKRLALPLIGGLTATVVARTAGWL
jgi:DcuC family C4-dicarboxylate transporter